jgi:murein DD-endopeptidase MepM/ murein hydrolase activator NlpD
MKRILCYTLIMLLIAGLSGWSIGFGVKDAQSELSNITEEIKALQTQLQQGKQVETQLSRKINELQSKINLTQSEINALSGNIAATEAKIAVAYGELEKLEAEIAVQNEALNARLRAMYKNGSVSYIDVLLGSNSITDLMTNIDRVQRVYQSDKEVMLYLDAQHKIVESQRLYLASMQQQLELNVADIETKQSQLSSDKATVASQRSAISEENKKIEREIDALNEEANRLIAEIRALQGDAAYAGGIMAWPSPGVTRVTSEFGYRIHPILKYKKLHTGIDIGCPTGTTIVAANFGTVIKAEWNNSYGNLVMVDHGGGIVTLYAHLSSFLVQKGDVVNRGQAIAKSGSTGMSTGPHLHFEVRVNGEYQNPRNWI